MHRSILLRLVHRDGVARVVRSLRLGLVVTIIVCGCRSGKPDDPNLRELFKLYRVAMVPNKPEYIAFHHTGIDDSGMQKASEYLAGYGVVDLDMRGTAISDTSIPALLQIQSIQTLHLTGTRITLSGMKRLAELSHLRSLIIEQGRFDEDEIHELQDALPSVEIDQVYWPMPQEIEKR